MLHNIEMIDFVSFIAGLYPIAFAIVSEENDSNWEYFFQYLKVAVGTSRNLTFVSDRQHGIIASVKNVFPDAVHGFCLYIITLPCAPTDIMKLSYNINFTQNNTSQQPVLQKWIPTWFTKSQKI